MLTVKNTYYFSLVFQTLSLLLFIITYNIPIVPEQRLLNDAYSLEFLVSIIEFFGYIILGYYINTKTNITTIRYADWFITTNVLLVSFSLFLLYNKIKQSTDHTQRETLDQLSNKNVISVIKENSGTYVKMLSANTAMLIFGFLGELKILKKIPALVLGMFFFILSFYYLLSNFAGYVPINMIVSSVFISIWLCYAVAFMCDFTTKNIMYNLLDLVSKNLFGIFLFFYMAYA